MPSWNSVIGSAARYGFIPAVIQSKFIKASLGTLRENFDLVPVTNDLLAAEAARIRYEVYCEDYAYELAANLPDHKEKDAFDSRSLQVLLRYKPKNLYIGTVRLILPLADENYLESYPTQKICDAALFKEKDYIAKTCEVSRFCLSKKRRNSLHKFMDAKSFARIRPVMNVALITGIIQTAHEHGFDRLCGSLEPWLINKLNTSGWQFNKIGPLVEFHGLRQPCEGSVSAGLNGIQKKYPEIWKYIVGSPCLWRSGDGHHNND